MTESTQPGAAKRETEAWLLPVIESSLQTMKYVTGCHHNTHLQLGGTESEGTVQVPLSAGTEMGA